MAQKLMSVRLETEMIDQLDIASKRQVRKRPDTVRFIIQAYLDSLVRKYGESYLTEEYIPKDTRESAPSISIEQEVITSEVDENAGDDAPGNIGPVGMSEQARRALAAEGVMADGEFGDI